MGESYKIAVISDIHSNYVALKAVMDEIDQMQVDDIVIAGDIIGGFVQPNQTIELIREYGAKAIHGNREDYLRSYIAGRQKSWDDYHQMRPIIWTNDELTSDNKDYLLNLPTHIEFEAKGTSFKMVHGSLRRVNELIYKHETEKIKEALACAKEDVLICGHCHQQWHSTVDDTLIVNPGSAGLSFIKQAKATYSILIFEDGQWSVAEKRASYSAEAVQKAFKDAAINDYTAWENMLMHSVTDGKVTTLAFLKYAHSHAVSNGWEGNGRLIPNKHWHSASREFDWKNHKCVFDKNNIS
jgi:putative phosphoesterase